MTTRHSSILRIGDPYNPRGKKKLHELQLASWGTTPKPQVDQTSIGFWWYFELWVHGFLFLQLWLLGGHATFEVTVSLVGKVYIWKNSVHQPSVSKIEAKLSTINVSFKMDRSYLSWPGAQQPQPTPTTPLRETPLFWISPTSNPEIIFLEFTRKKTLEKCNLNKNIHIFWREVQASPAER